MTSLLLGHTWEQITASHAFPYTCGAIAVVIASALWFEPNKKHKKLMREFVPEKELSIRVFRINYHAFPLICTAILCIKGYDRLTVSFLSHF
jgi:hypothetical protein